MSRSCSSRKRKTASWVVTSERSVWVATSQQLAAGGAGAWAAASTAVNSATHEGARLGVLETTASRGTIRARVKTAASPIVSIASSKITLRLAKANGDGTWQAPGNCNNACYQAREKDDLLIVSTDYSHTPLLGYVFPGITIPSSASAELTVEGDAA